MAQYQGFDPTVEVRGETVVTVVDGALARFSEEYRDVARTALADHGIEDPAPDEWYPQQAWLNTFETIADELEPHLLDRLGGQIPDAAEWPADVESVVEGLERIDEAYRRNHRGGEVGHYRFESTGDRRGRVVCRNPYPCEFDRGLVRAVARRYAPVGSFVFVEERGEECRREGDDVCTYTVHW